MPKYLDLSVWPRRAAFEFFRTFDKPYFNVCVHCDVSRLLDWLARRGGGAASLAYHYIALRAANEVEPFRYRLRDGQVVVHDVIHGGTTVLLENESFTFAYFAYTTDFDAFMENSARAVADARSGEGGLSPRSDDDAMIHFTTLPWISFTSFSHARNWGREDSVPKIAFGKFNRTGSGVLLPISVEVHHAMMDGLHVGRWLERVEKYLSDPDALLGGASE